MDLKTVNQCDFCLHASNSSCSRTASSAPVCVGLYMLVAAVVLVTVCGNLLVIISICCFRHLHTPTNLIVLSLAVADLLVGLTVMPFHFTYVLESCWLFGMFACYLFHMCSCLLSCVSVYSVVFIAVDRYVAVQNPFLYNSKMTVSLSLQVISLIWLYSLVYTIFLIYVNGNFDMVGKGVCPGECYANITELWAYVDVMCVLVISCFIIIVLYGNIFLIAKRHIRAISGHNSMYSRKTNGSVASEAKAALNLGIVVGVFLLCCIPYAVTLFVSLKPTNLLLLDAVTNALTPLLLNSAMNPIIYAVFYTWFQRCVKHMLASMLRHSQSALLSVPKKY